MSPSGRESTASDSGLELGDLVARLRDPAAYPHPVDAVEVIQTHISYVLLAGGYAYKLKKPVDFGFLNFKSLKRRRHFCRREVELNSRLSAGLYLGVVPIYANSCGVHVSARPIDRGPLPTDKEEAARALEYAVKMRRLPPDRMMDSLLESGQLPEDGVSRLAQRVARFHEEAPAGPKVARFGSPEETARVWKENFQQTEHLVGLSHTWAQRLLLTKYVQSALARHRPLLLERMRGNRIREGHGDLRTSAVCFDSSCPGGICIFDCIEFNRRFRCCDVASEVAFLAMDLGLHGRADLSREFVDAYVSSSGDEALRQLLPFYGCSRAFVRGKVEGFRFQAPEVSERDRAQALLLARKGFALACRYADQDRPPLLMVMSGLSATGKSTLANALAAERCIQVISSDLVRKGLAGLPAGEARPEPFGAGLYSPKRKQSVYEALFRQASTALSKGKSVILDATFDRRAHRERARAIAEEQGAYFFCVESRAGEDAVRLRMEERERHGSSSDARWPVYLRQRAEFEPIHELDEWSHIVVNTSGSLHRSVSCVLSALDERLTPSGVGEPGASP